MTRLQPVARSAKVFAYENRMGVTYYLHEGRTKIGKPRYFFAKTVGQGALGAVPKDFEVSEGINGVVSLRRKTAGGPSVPDDEVKVVAAAVDRQLLHGRGGREARAGRSPERPPKSPRNRLIERANESVLDRGRGRTPATYPEPSARTREVAQTSV